MNKKTKRFWLSVLSVGALGASTAFAACNLGQTNGPKFLKGIQTDMLLGESIMLGHFIDYVEDGKYTVIITGPDGYQEDVTHKSYWSPEEPGEYTVTYTVLSGKSKGTNSFVMDVRVPTLSWEYTMNNVVYDTGDKFYFDTYFEEMNVSAMSFYPWEMVMDSVTVGGEKIEFDREDTYYEFAVSGEHIFESHIETEDGQTSMLKQSINVRYVDPTTLAWLEENNVDVHNGLRLDADNKIILDESIYSMKDSPNVPWGSTEKHMASYIAFNGEYSFNDFVVFDFTGNNMPAITFFNDEINDNPFYAPGASDEYNKGLLISNGWTTGLGKPFSAWETSINNSLCVYGPYKSQKVDWDLDGWFRHAINGGSGVGMTNLTREQNANHSYRMALGITEGDENGATIAVYCFNMTTGQVMVDATFAFDTTETSKFPEDYFTGSIVLYSMYGKTTTLDRIYAIEEDTSMADLKDKYFETAQYIDGVKMDVRIGEVLNVSDYIAVSAGANYKLGYYDEAGAYVAITGDTFAFASAGLYKLSYDDGEHLPVQITMQVLDVDNATAQFIEEHNLSYYNIQSAKDNKWILKAATHDGDPGAAGYGTGITADMSYIAFNGEYGLNDYLVFDFTGNNMPFISFFNNQVTKTVFNNTLDTTQKGFVIGSGMYTPDGAMYNEGGPLSIRLTMFGPNKCAWYDADKEGQFRYDIDGDSPIALYNLKASTAKYRVIVGFNGTGTNAHGNYLSIQMLVVDLTSGAKVCQYSNVQVLYFDTCKPEDFVGSIALHGQFAKTTTIDQIYPIEENATMQDMIKKYADISEFKENAETEVYTNTTFNVADYIQLEQGASYTLTLVDGNGNETPITGETFSFSQTGTYKLIFKEGDKYAATLTLDVSPRPSEFNAFAAMSVQVGDVLNVADYIVAVNGYTYSFKYVDESGNETVITDETFSFSKAGTYTLYYMDGLNTEVSKALTVIPATSKFQKNANTSVAVGQTLNVSDYIVTVAGAQYTLVYQNAAGDSTPIPGATFAFNAVGVYTLVYSDGVNLENKLTVSVANLSAAAQAWVQENNVSYHNVLSIDDNQKVVFGESTVDGDVNPNASGVTRDMSYLAFNGSYGAGDYLVIEFTGSNMPYITFAAGSVTNDAWNVRYNEDGSRAVADMTDAGKGITVFNGHTNTDGTTCQCAIEGRLNFTGPFKMQDIEQNVENQAICQGYAAHENIGVNELVEGHKYRLMIGIFSANQTRVVFGVCLLDLTTGGQNYFTKDGIAFNVASADLSNINGSLFEGSIILHGQFGKQTTIDKVYSIYENWKDVDEVKWSF